MKRGHAVNPMLVDDVERIWRGRSSRNDKGTTIRRRFNPLQHKAEEKRYTKTKRCWLDPLEQGRGEAVTNTNSRRRFQQNSKWWAPNGQGRNTRL